MRRKLARIIMGLMLALALGAPMLASDLPLVLELHGERFWLPNVMAYPELGAASGHDLRDQMGAADWAIWAPIRHGPTSVRSDGVLRVLEPPSSRHWLGTDDRGRDVLARLVHGTRSTAVVAFGAVVLALAVGTLLGVVAAARGGVADAAVVGLCDLIGAVPALLVVVAAQGLIGRDGLVVVVALIALPRSADIARIARSQLALALAQPYCDAARAIGASELHIVIRQALPQARAALTVAAAMTAVTAVLGEAALSFLGFGVPTPGASWGELLKQAHENDLTWWLAIPPGIVITAVAASLSALAQPR